MTSSGSSALSAALNAYDGRRQLESPARGAGSGDRTSIVDVPSGPGHTTTDTFQRIHASTTPRSASPARRYGSPYSRQVPNDMMLLSASAPSAAARRRRLSNGSVLSTTPPLSAISKSSLGSGGVSRPHGSSPPLNTNSPIALAAAAAVTPEKLSRLLLSQGPLAIRHITSHLALTIPGFADLSLSKQRRLIIAALDSGDSSNGVVFEKVGWGRWAAKKTSGSDGTGSKSAPPPPQTTKTTTRRESITAHLAAQQVRPPVSPVLRGTSGRWGDSDDVDLADDDMMFHNKPVFDDDDDDLDDDLDDDELDELDDNDMYASSHRQTASHSAAAAAPRRSRAGSGVGRGGATDDEDWRSMGAASLRKSSSAVSGAHGTDSIPSRFPKIEQASPPSFVVDLGELGLKLGPREQAAIDALVQMRSI